MKESTYKLEPNLLVYIYPIRHICHTELTQWEGLKTFELIALAIGFAQAI